jgi:hypothetical protein
MMELPVEVFAFLAFHLAILSIPAIYLIGLIVYAIALFVKSVVLYFSAFVELAIYPDRVPLNMRAETWYTAEEIEAERRGRERMGLPA